MTAVAVAAGRAVETTRPDRLMADPFAAALVDGAQSSLDLPVAWPAEPQDAPPLQHPLLLASTYIGMRTRFIDDILSSGDPTGQTVILGAGLDTRAYRLPWQDGARLLELDLGGVLGFKAGVMAGLAAEPGCELVSVPADLSLPWGGPLRAAGFDPDQATTWVIEGLLPYLDSDAQLQTLTEVVALSAPGSRAVIERAVALPRTDDFEAQLREFSDRTGLPMTELLARTDPPDPARVLEEAGWRCTRHTVQELCSRYGRRISLNPDAGDPGAGPSGTAGSPDEQRGGFVQAWL
ncbi:SAM-dependent methyltransferase [Arthrobacter sp. PM3]|uniref:SAM-dependent methyltransferase n=1 Tax=Arthrobacter sp. PM3 TaxID=2017685 RepID=UPI0021C44628|nr:SAM-dependent methyltransferase [Arthrobacter sp. PM3]